jgi:hypothetical protein
VQQETYKISKEKLIQNGPAKGVTPHQEISRENYVAKKTTNLTRTSHTNLQIMTSHKIIS